MANKITWDDVGINDRILFKENDLDDGDVVTRNPVQAATVNWISNKIEGCQIFFNVTTESGRRKWLSSESETLIELIPLDPVSKAAFGQDQ